jgi:hypothetical protein
MTTLATPFSPLPSLCALLPNGKRTEEAAKECERAACCDETEEEESWSGNGSENSCIGRGGKSGGKEESGSDGGVRAESERNGGHDCRTERRGARYVREGRKRLERESARREDERETHRIVILELRSTSPPSSCLSPPSVVRSVPPLPLLRPLALPSSVIFLPPLSPLPAPFVITAVVGRTFDERGRRIAVARVR